MWQEGLFKVKSPILKIYLPELPKAPQHGNVDCLPSQLWKKFQHNIGRHGAWQWIRYTGRSGRQRVRGKRWTELWDGVFLPQALLRQVQGGGRSEVAQIKKRFNSVMNGDFGEMSNPQLNLNTTSTVVGFDIKMTVQTTPPPHPPQKLFSHF